MTTYYTETSEFSQVPFIPVAGQPVKASDMRSAIQALVNRDAYTREIIGDKLSQTHSDLITKLIKYDPHYSKTEGIDEPVTISLPLTNMKWNTLWDQTTATCWRQSLDDSQPLCVINDLSDTTNFDKCKFILDIPVGNFYNTYISNVTAYVSNVSNSLNKPKLTIRGQNIYSTTPDYGKIAYISDNASNLIQPHTISLNLNPGERIPIYRNFRYVVTFSPGFGTSHTAGLVLYGITCTFTDSNS